jgi:hypothetical protein
MTTARRRDNQRRNDRTVKINRPALRVRLPAQHGYQSCDLTEGQMASDLEPRGMRHESAFQFGHVTSWTGVPRRSFRYD